MKYSKEILQDIVSKTFSFAEVCRELDIKENTGSHSRLIALIKEFGIDTDHFTSKVWNKGKTLGYRRPLEDYITNKIGISSWKLKNRLFEEGKFKKFCSSCNLDKWLGEEMPLELDHINGDNKDNRLENLRILCPNCHTRTVTYKSKNRKSR